MNNISKDNSTKNHLIVTCVSEQKLFIDEKREHESFFLDAKNLVIDTSRELQKVFLNNSKLINLKILKNRLIQGLKLNYNMINIFCQFKFNPPIAL